MRQQAGIVDAHVHFWDPRALDYPWLAEAPAINRAFLPADYDQAIGELPIHRLVFVQCDAAREQALAEVHWVNSLSSGEPRIAAIVAFAPLEQGESVRGHLQALSALPLVRGVRRLIQSEADERFCLQGSFVRGVQMLAEFDFTFDLCIYHQQLASTIELVEQCPNVRFVLDHLGKPNLRTGELDRWRTNLAALAKASNVFCKISGLATEADPAHWRAHDLLPCVQHAIDCFGPERVMFGSDWPVVTLAGGYQRWWQALQDCLACVNNPPTHEQLFWQNAGKFYCLDSVGGAAD